ncbi:hypothetical protein EOD39_5813 [Acipenser ruthenus]|uniref:Gamma-aminobutyric acid type B receptor subunit 2 n=1 Tax=Acipenser ruthenus TaxID=7906 RepID=A0A662Z0Q2_ACIRT|nr:hypothetical protein EOD39_5813 [Acipenser ruthenus]
MFAVSGCMLLFVLGYGPVFASVPRERTGHSGHNAGYTSDGKQLPIMVLMPMNETAPMSNIGQGIHPAVLLAIQHINESKLYSFSLIPEIYDTEVLQHKSQFLLHDCRSTEPVVGSTEPIYLMFFLVPEAAE